MKHRWIIEGCIQKLKPFISYVCSSSSGSGSAVSREKGRTAPYPTALKTCGALVFQLWLVVSLSPAALEASPRPKSQTKQRAHEVAPDRSDHSAYFSESRQGIPPEKLREADQLRVQTIGSIQKLLETPNMTSARRFELYLRLGELYAERSEYLRTLEMKDYEQRFDQWKRNGKNGSEPVLQTKNSQAELLKSTDAFRRLVREFPKHPRTDAALYALAKTMLLLENDNAVLYFNQIVKEHPNSPLLPDTYLALGEFYFYKHDMEKAKEFYRLAMNFKESRVYPFAVYKLGWAHYNSNATNERDTQENIDKAIAAFKLAIKISDKDKSGSKNFNLRQESINDLIMVFAETERIDEAMDYFSRLGEKEAFYDMLERLGSIYEENGENSKAIEVFNRLLTESPTRPRNPQIHARLAKLYDSSLNAPALVETMKKMRSLYVDPSSRWRAAHTQDKAILEEAAESTRKNIHRYATLYHQQGQKLKKAPYLEAAAELYRLYLANFPKTEEAYELRYYLADIYFSFEQFENAADEYFRVSQERAKTGKFLKESALNAVVSIRKIDEASQYQELPPLGQVAQPIPLPRVKQKLVTKIDNFVGLLPQDKEGHPMRYTAAMTYFEYGHYPEALKRFESLGTELPETTQGKSSIKMILSFYAERKDWENLVTYSRKYYEQPKIAATPLREDILKNLKSGLFQLALQQSKDGKFYDAARTFESYQQQFPDDENSDKSLYNASINYYKVAKVEEALAAGNLLLRMYPKSKLAGDVTLDMAQTNEALADFAHAAKLYKAYGISYPKEPRARLALYNAATLYKGLKEYPESTGLFRRFIQTYPKDELVRRAYLEIGEMAELRQSWDEAIQAYTTYAGLWPDKSEQALIARARIAKIQLQAGQQKDGQREIRRLTRDLSGPQAPAAFEARRIAATALLTDLEADTARFMEMRVSDASRIEKDAASKQEVLLNLVKRYQEVIDLGSGEHTVAAVYRLGEMHENFAKTLFDAPPPRGGTQAEVDAYRSSIEKVAFPLREEAHKFFETAYKRSQEVQTFTEWTRRAHEKMVEIQPDKYPAVIEKTSSPTYMSHAMIWDESVADLAE